MFFSRRSKPRRTAPGRLAAGLLVAGLVMGCLTVGRDFPTQAVEQIQIGETTRKQIEEWFGAPWRTGIEDGRRTWTYGLYQYPLLGEPRTRDLVVRFDAEGTVVSFSYNTTHRELAPQ